MHVLADGEMGRWGEREMGRGIEQLTNNPKYAS
jgi:hypothetical protein